MVINSLFKNKMDRTDIINAHVNKVVSMGNLLKDLGKPIPQDMLITKIIYNLLPSYNSILAAWANEPAVDQTVANPKVRLQMKTLMSMQGGDKSGDKSIFNRTSKPDSKAHTKKGHHKRDTD